MLGNCIGKGAFGSVWRGLLATGTTVAVKQINLSDIPSAELDNIMHANIVKYYGFEKTDEYLNIILEFCENGSLRSLCKNFGKLPEHLGATYITQVLDGLIYLHDQGVIHRDIKGANILATKEGVVKLADFGVATLSNDVGDMSVAGTPYWMAPEIIELSGATTASDIWSVGCTVIELLDGEPPYHDLPPMGALYRIVQDDHPPIPESVSAIVRDFLMQCFQKDCNLRVSAKKLSKHPWIQMSKKKATGSQRSREKAVPAYEEAVKSVQQWNEALKGSSNRNSGKMRRISNDKAGRSWEHGVPAMTSNHHASRPQIKELFSVSVAPAESAALANGSRERPPITISPPRFHLPTNNLLNNKAIVHTTANTKNVQNYEENVTDNWDDDFADGALSFQIAAQGFRDQEDEVSKTIRAMPSSAAPVAATAATTTTTPARRHPAYSNQTESPGGSDMDDDDFEENTQDFRLKIKTKALENKRRQAGSKQADGSIKPSGSLAARSKAGGQFVPIDLVRSKSAPGELVLEPPVRSNNFQNYREEEDEDFSDLFESAESQGNLYQDEGLTLQTRLSNHSWFGNDAGSDEEDPFAEVDEGFDEIDLEANIAREKYARICANISEQFRLLENQNNQRSEKQLEAVCDRLEILLTENPDARGPMMANHGAIPLLDLIENSKHPNLVLKLLNILNMASAIPVLIKYTSKCYVKEIQLAAALFIQQICHTNSLTLQMFISCRGLSVLIDFLKGNYSTQKELVWIAINGIHSVFKLQSLTPRNDFCRLLAKQGLLDPLSWTLYSTLKDPQGAPYTDKIVQVLLIFSQGDSPVKELLATRPIVHCMLTSLQNLPPNLCVMMLKCIKNISMNSNTLDVLQNASAISTLVHVLNERASTFDARSYQDVCNHILTTLFNLCRINKARQEEAAQAGLIPHLQQIAESTSPLKQFALPILCDMAHAGRACRNSLWHNDCLPVYLRLFKDPNWQVNAMDAVHVWLQDEREGVENILLQPSSLNLFVQAFLNAKANSFENILEPLHKIIRFSPSIACGIAVPALFNRLLDRLAHPKAVVRSNLLRILRAIFDVHPERLQVVIKYGIRQQVERIAAQDNAVLVRELAKEILDVFEESDSEGTLSSKGGYGEDEDEDDDGEAFSVEFSRNRGPNPAFDSTRGLFSKAKNRTNLADSRIRLSKAPRYREECMVSELMLDDLDPNKRTPLQQYSHNGRIKGTSSVLSQHNVEDLFQQEVIDSLNVKDAGRVRHKGRKYNTDNNDSDTSASTPKGIVRSQPQTSKNDDGDLRTNSPGSEDDHFVTSRIWIDSSSNNSTINTKQPLSSIKSKNTTGVAHPITTTGTTIRIVGSANFHSSSNPNPINRHTQQKHQATSSREPMQTAWNQSSRLYGHQKSRSLGEILESYVAEGKEQSHRLLDGLRTEDLSESMILRREMPKFVLDRLDRMDLLDVDYNSFRGCRDSVEYESEEEEEEEEEKDSEEDDEQNDSTDESEEDVQEELSESEEVELMVEESLLSSTPSALERKSPSLKPAVYNSVNTASSAKELAKILQEFQGSTTSATNNQCLTPSDPNVDFLHQVQQQQRRSGPSSRGTSANNSSDPTIRIRGPVFPSSETLSGAGLLTRRISHDGIDVLSVPSFSAISSAAAAGGWNRRLLEDNDDDGSDEQDQDLLHTRNMMRLSPLPPPVAPEDLSHSFAASGSTIVPGLTLAHHVYDDELDFSDDDDGVEIENNRNSNGDRISSGDHHNAHNTDRKDKSNSSSSERIDNKILDPFLQFDQDTININKANYSNNKMNTQLFKNSNNDSHDDRHYDDHGDDDNDNYLYNANERLEDVVLSDNDDDDNDDDDDEQNNVTVRHRGFLTQHHLNMNFGPKARKLVEEDEEYDNESSNQVPSEAEEIDWDKEERRRTSSSSFTSYDPLNGSDDFSTAAATLRRRRNRHHLSQSSASISASASATSLLSAASSASSTSERIRMERLELLDPNVDEEEKRRRIRQGGGRRRRQRQRTTSNGGASSSSAVTQTGTSFHALAKEIDRCSNCIIS
ncbi:hypothetical protein FBU30_008814 [Linnemannia zychae]|nr:hypothetical protein FBU30_008814 [Linnemannia zychae]